MADQQFNIAAVSIIDAPVNAIGNRLLASFNLSVAGLRIHGCVLIEKATGVVQAEGPRGKTHSGISINTRFEDPALARAVTRRMAEVYTNLTGREVSDE